jgi:tetratricopeptide (TPR) repeat protein
LFGLAAGLSALTFYLQKITGTVVKPDILPFQVRFFNAMISYGKYIAKFFWPAKLSFLYPYPPLPLPIWQIVVSVAILAGISVFVLKFHRQKYLFVGWLWFLGILVPVIGFIQVGVQAMADRYTYVSYVGLFIMVAWGMSDLLANRKHGRIVLASAMFIAIAAMAASAYFQLGYWKNSITLSSHAAEVTQNKLISHLARNNVAWILATSPDPNMRNSSEAIRIAEELSSETNYSNPAVLDTLGAAYASAGRFAEAIEITQKALSLVDKNDEYTLEQFHRHLDFYKVSKPYIETRRKDQNEK